MDRLTLSDERLMALSKGGDEQAFQALVRRFGSVILTLTTRVLCDRAAAEEVFVDVVSTLWLRRSTYEVGRPVRPWLLAIAANACRQRRRRARRPGQPRTPYDGFAGTALDSPTTEGRMVAIERTTRLAGAIGALPDRQREALVLRVWGELSYFHVGEAMGVSEATARSNMHHALAALRRSLGSLGEVDADPDTRPGPHQAPTPTRRTTP